MKVRYSGRCRKYMTTFTTIHQSKACKTYEKTFNQKMATPKR